MNEGLLQTKLIIPQQPPSLVARPWLTERLNAGLEGAATMVVAPAGFGKTTLVAEWVRHEARVPGQEMAPPVAWFSVDEADNDLALFLAYLAAALQEVLATAGQATLAMLQGPRLPAVEALITPLINDLSDISMPFLVVLDDYHLVREPSIHDLLAYLIAHRPPMLHLVIISRADPPLPLARLRGQGMLHELRQHDLAFNADEAGELLKKTSGLSLDVADVARLTRRTEGWPAGLQMAAASLAQQADPPAFIRNLSGSNRYILDYLMEEVLAQQPSEMQQFLLRTAILERMTAPLCAYLLADTAQDRASGAVAALSALAHLDAANLFVVPLDEERRWYRYHRLFADLLRQRLQQIEPDLIPTLHARARDWYWQEGWTAEAVAHALQAEDRERAAQMVEIAAETALRRSQVQNLLQWVQALPQAMVRGRPRLSLAYAWALLLSGAPLDTIEKSLSRSATDHGEEQQPYTPPAGVLLDAFIATMRGQMEQARRLAQQALDAFPEKDMFWRTMAVWVLSISYHDPTSSLSEQAISWEEAVREAAASGNLLVLVSAMCEQGHAQKRHGRLHEARTVFARARDLATPEFGRPLPVAGEALLGLAEIDLEWNEVASANELLAEGLALTHQWREAAALPGYLQLARLRQAREDAEGAREALREAARLATLFDATELDDAVVAAYRARLAVMQGRLAPAQAWAKQRDSESGAPPYASLRPFEDLVLARLWLAQGKINTAIPTLDRLLETFAGWQHTRLMIETLLLRAQTLAARGLAPEADADLHRALELGEPGGFVRVFLDEGLPVLRLLHNLPASKRGLQSYGERLVAAFAVANEQPQPLIEPLSPRELEVLQLIAEGLSNREIGQRLFLSLPTVKWHTSNIYGKLAVNNRTMAVAKARDLCILPA